jgi:hypothetical protein
MDTLHNLPNEEIESQVGHRTYSPVDVKMDNTLGAIFLGVLSVILLFVLLREQARNRALLAQLNK